jgi:hypothetical protein
MHARTEAVEDKSLFTPQSPAGLMLTRLTTDTSLYSRGLYMETPAFFDEDSRFIFLRCNAEEYDRAEKLKAQGQPASWQLWMCDIAGGKRLMPIVTTRPVRGAVAAPDGKHAYYYTCPSTPQDEDTFSIRRVNVTTLKDEVVADLSTIAFHAGRPIGVGQGTLRADGGAYALHVNLRDKNGALTTRGVMVHEFASGESRLVCESLSLTNTHVQYSRCTEEPHMRDLLVQENHGHTFSETGEVLSTRPGCFLFVVNDAGGNRRRIPCGKLSVERVHGHQEWRGTLPSVVAGVDVFTGGKTHCAESFPSFSVNKEYNPIADEQRIRILIESTPLDDCRPVEEAYPLDCAGAEALRNNITSEFPEPYFAHTAFDSSGTRFVGDWLKDETQPETARLYSGIMGQGPGSKLELQYLLDPKSTWTRGQLNHPHPCISPSGKVINFNSDASGHPSVWLLENCSVLWGES